MSGRFKKRDTRPGDKIRWIDNWSEPPVEREATIVVELSMQYLVVDSHGVERFVFKQETYERTGVEDPSGGLVERYAEEVPSREASGGTGPETPELGGGITDILTDTGTVDTDSGGPSEGSAL